MTPSFLRVAPIFPVREPWFFHDEFAPGSSAGAAGWILVAAASQVQTSVVFFASEFQGGLR